MSQMPECWRNNMRLCYKSFGINMTCEKSETPNLDPNLVLMPQVLVGAGWSSRPCFDMLCIPTNYLPQGATGSHFNLRCLHQWDIAGFKTGIRGGTTLKNLYTQQTWINFKPTHWGKQKGLSKKYFYPHCCFILQWIVVIAHVDAWSMFQRADWASDITSVEMSLEFRERETFPLNLGHIKGAEN